MLLAVWTRRCTLVFALSLLLNKNCASGFAEPPLRAMRRPLSSLSATKDKPILVVGATGKVGRKVVEQLLEKKKPVRAVVRNRDKAREIFGTSENAQLEIIDADLGNYDTTAADALDKAVEGCGSIISVSGTMRFSKFLDWLPWRHFSEDKSWADRSHPYFCNYRAQCLLVDLAEKHSVPRFVRLTGLSTSFSPFSFFTILFSSIISMTTMYHFLFEQYLLKSKVPHVAILRPGGLASEDRDLTTTFLQVDSSGLLPPPGRVPRTDVAALAVAFCDPKVMESSSDKSRYIFAIRAVGDMKPKPQGQKEDGYATAEECLKNISEPATLPILPASDISAKVTKYTVAVGGFVYLFLFGSLTFLSWTITSVLGWIVPT